MKVTVIRLALIMVCGILFTDFMGIISSVVICLLASVGLWISFMLKRNIDIGSIVFAVAFLTASVSYSFSISSFYHPTLDYTDRYVTLTGTTITPAKESIYNNNYRYTFRVKYIENARGRFETNDTILLTSKEKLCCGDSIKVKGIIKTMPGKMNENGFDASAYYLSKNIMTRIYSDDITPSDKIHSFSLTELGGRLQERTDELIYRFYDGDNAAILSAVLTGNTSHFSHEYANVLTKTAFKRIFHPAYLHIWLILSVVGLVRSKMKRQYRDMLTAVIFIIYALLQCSNIGFARCLICSSITILYRLRHGESYLPDSIATVVIFCAVAVPTMIFNVSFILSVSGGLIIWAFVPYVVKRLRYVPKVMRRPIAVSIVCALFFAPVSSFFFTGVCVYSFFMPIITAPVVILLLILSPVTLLLLSSSGFSLIFQLITDLAIDFLHALPLFIYDLPFSHINIGNPSKPMMFAIVTAILAAYYFTRNRKRDFKFMSALCSGFCFAVLTLAVMRIPSTEFTFVNVGQGDGALIHKPFGATIIIDGGGGAPYSDYNPGELVFLPYLQAEGCNHIDAAIVSHYHQDHIQGVISVIENIKTDIVYAPKPNDSDSDTMKKWADELRCTAQENGTEICYITEDTRTELGELVVDMYLPNKELGKLNENDTSMPVRVQYGDFSVLYTGDMSAAAEKSFISDTDADSDVLKVSHHGSGGSSCREFINEVTPRYSVISCGLDNMYAHPHDETLERLKGSRVLRTDLLGDITISAYKNGNCTIK